MSKIDVIAAREQVDVETLIEKPRTESLYKNKATLEIMDLCMAAADALERLNDFQNSQYAKLLADITTLHNTVAIAQREAARAQKERDAAVGDMTIMANAIRESELLDTVMPEGCCFACRHEHNQECPGYESDVCFEWRGMEVEG